MQKAILVDFNGVLNNPNIQSNARYAAHQIREEICLKKLKILMDFSVKHNAIPISVSSFNNELPCLDFYFLLEEEYPELTESFEKLFIEGMQYHVFSSDKSIINKELLQSLKGFKVVCFEDYFKFDPSFNQIWTKNSIGLTLEHIEKAEKIFNTI